MAQESKRIIVLVDMDCFYCQVEEKLNPLLSGKPMAVVQYNTWQGGGIIAVNYAARDRGVTRHMRGKEAKEKCPEIQLVQVPELRGKADLTKYREAGKRVAEVLQTFTPLLERASVDEAYLDITERVKEKAQVCKAVELSKMENTYVVGHGDETESQTFMQNVYRDSLFAEEDYHLIIGGLIASEIRAAVYEKTGYRCSAGIAHNKVLAKLVCGLNKPNKQTILPHESVPLLYETLPIKKVRSLGGKFGDTLVDTLKISKMGELMKFSKKELSKHFDEKSVNWLYNIARGFDFEPVTPRFVSKSIGCCKQFAGRTALRKPEEVMHWLSELAEELTERLSTDLTENNRRAKQMTVNYAQEINKKDVSSSRTLPLHSYDKEKMVKSAMEVVQKNCMKNNTCHIKFLGFSVNHFEDVKKVREITSFFKVGPQINQTVSKEEDVGSDSTDIMSDIGEDVVLFDDVYPERCGSVSPVLSRFPINKPQGEEGDLSEDSIINELSPDSPKTDLNESQVGDSYFGKYFSNVENTNERNFDTSKIFEDIDENTATSVNEEVQEEEERVASETLFEECTECHKKIAIADLISHMDYHVAIKMVREEAHLYRNVPESRPNTSPKKDKKPTTSKKRKSSCSIQSSSMLQFLKSKPEDIPDENSELCTQCNKKIKLDEFSSHLDYHAAKELHRQLNTNIIPKKNIIKPATSLKKKSKKK